MIVILHKAHNAVSIQEQDNKRNKCREGKKNEEIIAAECNINANTNIR